MSALTTLLDSFRSRARTEREKGTYFEELTVGYLHAIGYGALPSLGSNVMHARGDTLVRVTSRRHEMDRHR